MVEVGAPHHRLLVGTGGGEEVTAWRERDGIDTALVAVQRIEEPPLDQIPNLREGRVMVSTEGRQQARLLEGVAQARDVAGGMGVGERRTLSLESAEAVIRYEPDGWKVREFTLSSCAS